MGGDAGQVRDVLIVGAGAAGLTAAIQARAAAPALDVVAVDAARSLGAKILVSGGGRCNVTNESVRGVDFAGSSPHAVDKVLRQFDAARTRDWFAGLGVALKREEGGKLFPVSDRAREVLDALLAEGCAVCRLARRASDSYIRALIYEGVTDVKLRENLRDARGLCHTHGWRMAGRRGSVLGTAIIYRDVVNTLVKALESQGDAAPRPFWRGQPELGRSLAAAADCPACVLERDAERRAVKILLDHADDAAIASAYIAAGGVCLPHFQLALTLASGSGTAALARWQAEAWSRLRANLDELIRKHDYRFRAEPVSDAEADAWQRAVAAVVGAADPERET